MNLQTYNFELLPRLVPADQLFEVMITPIPGHSFRELGEFTLYYRAHENILSDGRITADIVEHPVPEWRFDEEKIIIKGIFAEEQEHTLNLIEAGRDENMAIQKRKVLASFRLYSVKQDWHGLLPFRGNFHQHSNISPCCHTKEDTPAHVVAESRRIGLDFTTITDHSYYYSVFKALEDYQDFPIEIALFPGEEVHPMQWSQHVVNFGGCRSITELIESDKEKFHREVEEIQESYKEMPPQMDTFVMAATEWTFAKIREAGGLAILSHPYWYYYALNGLTVSPLVVDHLIRRHNFDAMEVVSGFGYNEVEYNNWQIVRWFEAQATGVKIPPLGVNDSHSCRGGDTFDWYSTIVLAESMSFEDIREAVLQCRSAAIEKLPDAPAKVYADMRLVKYAHFLLREYFPKHDELCRREAEIMQAHCDGDPNAADCMKQISASTEAWRKEFMGSVYQR
jgi:predicted metal-dependent phosphoesterase TrpH